MNKADNSAQSGRLRVEDLAWVGKIQSVLEEFRKINQNITANQILTFLFIATEEGIGQKELEDRTGLHNATVARIVAIMSDRGLKARSAEALDLIRINPVPGDYRARSQTLSHKGKKVFESLRSIMKGR